MLSQRWQVGVDIGPGRMYAAALARRREGWQLRRWWQSDVPEALFGGGRLQQPRRLGEWLRAWKRELPAQASIRLGLPPAQVMQRLLPCPDPLLSPAMRQEVLRMTVEKQFHLSCQELAYDYAPAASPGTGLMVTAARRHDLLGWLEALDIAGLAPAAMDVTPCALRRVAAQCGTPADKLLLHRTAQTLLWASPHPLPLAFGSVDTGVDDTLQALYAARQAGVAVDGCLTSGAVDDDGAPWSPFSFLTLLQPPLPRSPHDFSLALGLALHPGAGTWI